MEATANIKEAIALYLESLAAHNDPVRPRHEITQANSSIITALGRGHDAAGPGFLSPPVDTAVAGTTSGSVALTAACPQTRWSDWYPRMFVHRNVANVVVHTDLNCLSAISSRLTCCALNTSSSAATYSCGGILAALQDNKLGLIENWLRHVQDVRAKHRTELDALDTEKQQHDRLCELNVIEQSRT